MWRCPAGSRKTSGSSSSADDPATTDGVDHAPFVKTLTTTSNPCGEFRDQATMGRLETGLKTKVGSPSPLAWPFGFRTMRLGDELIWLQMVPMGVPSSMIPNL